MTRRRISPALAGSAALHLGVAAALLISWRFERDLKLGSVTPVTIVTKAQADDLRAAMQAPQTQAAQAEEPTPQAPPEPVPPAPQPAPAPPVPQPAAQARPEPPKESPAKSIEKTSAPQPHGPVRTDKALDLDALAASLSRMTKAAGGKASSAARGEQRAETAPQARPALGTADAAAALNGLTEELQRRWNPNCGVAEARAVMVHVTFTLNSGGGVMGDVRAQIRGPQNPASRAAADRAVSAVYAAAPFRTLPREFYGQPIGVNFDAQKACS